MKGTTYLIDLDGTIVPHLSIEALEKHVLDAEFIQELLPGVACFFKKAGKICNSHPDPAQCPLKNQFSQVIFTTARTDKYREMTERTLRFHGITYHHLIMNLPDGPRVLINDSTNVFDQKAIAINVLRNVGFGDLDL